jgi:hypothetical protein
LGKELFFSLCASEPELNCPGCGAYLLGQFDGDGLTFQSVNSRMQPLSERASVQPREAVPATADNALPSDDFSWLVALCRLAGQERLLQQIRSLYGLLVCPLCGREIGVMSEIMRDRGDSG